MVVVAFVKFIDKPQHVDSFVRGRIHAKRLSCFKKIESDSDSGRFDRHEGTTAWLQPGNGHRLVINSSEGNSIDMSDDLAGPIQMQASWLDDLNVFCVHTVGSSALNSSDIDAINRDEVRRELLIPEKSLTLGKYAVVVTNLPELVERMVAAARSAGYRIAWAPVKYYDPVTFHGWYPGMEAIFHKQSQFRDQREYRFVIETGSKGTDPINLDIGDIRDITMRYESATINNDWLGGEISIIPSQRNDAC